MWIERGVYLDQIQRSQTPGLGHHIQQHVRFTVAESAWLRCAHAGSDSGGTHIGTKGGMQVSPSPEDAGRQTEPVDVTHREDMHARVAHEDLFLRIEAPDTDERNAGLAHGGRDAAETGKFGWRVPQKGG